MERVAPRALLRWHAQRNARRSDAFHRPAQVLSRNRICTGSTSQGTNQWVQNQTDHSERFPCSHRERCAHVSASQHRTAPDAAENFHPRGAVGYGRAGGRLENIFLLRSSRSGKGGSVRARPESLPLQRAVILRRLNKRAAIVCAGKNSGAAKPPPGWSTRLACRLRKPAFALSRARLRSDPRLHTSPVISERWCEPRAAHGSGLLESDNTARSQLCNRRQLCA